MGNNLFELIGNYGYLVIGLCTFICACFIVFCLILFSNGLKNTVKAFKLMFNLEGYYHKMIVAAQTKNECYTKELREFDKMMDILRINVSSARNQVEEINLVKESNQEIHFNQEIKRDNIEEYEDIRELLEDVEDEEEINDINLLKPKFSTARLKAIQQDSLTNQDLNKFQDTYNSKIIM